MKKIIIMACCAILVSFSLNTFAKAPAKLKYKTGIRDSLPANTGKGYISYPDFKSYSNAVNVRIMREFIKKYKNPLNVTWYKHGWGCVVNFTIDSIENIAAYKNTGMCLYTIRKYSEKKMPPFLRHLVKTTYYDYKILLIDEININGQENTIYVVLLQAADHTKQVRVCDGEMQEILDFHG